jgi:hypothetical protein
MPEIPLDPDLAALSAALGGLTPNAPALSRDRLLYEAGRRAAHGGGHRIWQLAAGLFAVLSVGLGARLATAPPRVEFVYVAHPSYRRDPERSPAERSREERSPEERSPALRSGSRRNEGFALEPRGGYLRLRDEVVRFGVDSLASPIPRPAGPTPAVEELLGLPFGSLDDAQKSRWQHQLF